MFAVKRKSELAGINQTVSPAVEAKEFQLSKKDTAAKTYDF
jgi:hypothetical protein